jgi:hypothetical protein
MTKRKIEFDNSSWGEEDSSFACGGGSVRGASPYDGGAVQQGKGEKRRCEVPLKQHAKHGKRLK